MKVSIDMPVISVLELDLTTEARDCRQIRNII